MNTEKKTKDMMNPVEYSQIVEEVERTFLRRKMTVGKCKVDDFFCGAMAVMASISGDGSKMPPAWVFGIMQGTLEKNLKKEFGVDGNKKKEA